MDFELFTGCKERFLKGASAPGPEEGPLPGFLETARMHGVPVILSSHDFRKTPEPEELLLKDRPLQATVLLWGLACIVIFYFA